MKVAEIILLLLVWQTSFSQWSDDFSDGDFTNNPSWQGDTANFMIDNNSLRLSAPAVPGTSYIITGSENIINASWEASIMLKFNPSSSNYSKIYLVSNKPALNEPLNGYFIKIGGTPDEVSLYRQDGLSETRIIDGTDGRLSLGTVHVKVKATRDAEGNWQLFSMLDTETSWFEEGTTSDQFYVSSTYFGLVCIYTSTRSSKFYFDDIKVTGTAFVDDIPPHISSAYSKNHNQIILLFNESIDSTTAVTVENYLLNNTEWPTDVFYSDSSASLSFQNQLPVLNQLQVTNIQDLFKNILSDTTVEIVYVDPVPPVLGDVIINEIMADPSPREDLPEIEFLELFNTSGKAIDLTNWSVSDKITTTYLPKAILLPDSILILTKSTDQDLLLGYGSVVGLTPWPSLNNTGDSITLRSDSGTSVDIVQYSTSWYKDASKNNGGWTLERINPYQPCSGFLNWQASTDLAGGTPGKQNSVLISTDNLAPIITNYQINKNQAIIYFNEPIFSNPESITITPHNTITNTTTLYNQLKIEVAQSFSSGVNNTITLSKVPDCLGNISDIVSFTFVPDFIPPKVDTVFSTYPSTIEVYFDENILTPSVGNFYIENIGPPSTISLVKENHILLNYDNNLQMGAAYTLVADSLTDIYNNMTIQSHYVFTYSPLSYPSFGEVIVTEIMADPSPPVNLPEVEYIELTNKSNKPVLLKGLYLADSKEQVLIPTGIINPQERVILTKSSAVSKFSPPIKTVGVPNWPTLNNSSDEITLLDTNLQVINHVSYTVNWYDDDEKADGGWALELIDENNYCGGDKVWTASKNSMGGTPGKENSVSDNLYDLLIPHISQTYLVTQDTLIIQFSEPLNNQLPLVTIPNSKIYNIDFSSYNRDKLTLVIEPLQPRITYNVTVNNFSDCAGNLHTEETVSVILPETAEPGDVVISEVLFNPLADGADFIEFYNNSPKYISLQNWLLANANSIKTITLTHILKPYSFMVITPDKSNILAAYPKSLSENIYQAIIPAMPNEQGFLSLSDQNKALIDSIEYKDEWHFPYLSSTEGISLERIDLYQLGLNSNNWASASATENYATPGYINSHAIVEGNNPPVSVSPQVIVPDNDGRDDFINILITSGLGSLVTINIYNMQGQLVKPIANNVLAGSSSRYTWDGTNATGNRVPLGHYFVVFDTIDQDGRTKSFRKKVVVATGF